MSRFGENELRVAGLDPLYVPHGVNTEVFTPRDRTEMRQMLKLPEDAFIVGMVANNQGQSPARKAFSDAFIAFSVFRADHPDAMLYLHCEMTGFRNGLDLYRMLQRFDIPEESVTFTDQVMLEHVFPPGALAALYNCFDVLLNPSYGEGFGIPIVEAQACGTPVIVTDWTSMTELCGAGWKVGGTLWDHAMAEAFWMKPDVDQIVAALEEAYEAHDDFTIRERARQFAVQYDADKVLTDYWVPALEQIHKPREVQPLKPNRAMRRAKAKAGT
jgi:glycosyltransferase involved in cell wall biosynthesis